MVIWSIWIRKVKKTKSINIKKQGLPPCLDSHFLQKIEGRKYNTNKNHELVTPRTNISQK